MLYIVLKPTLSIEKITIFLKIFTKFKFIKQCLQMNIYTHVHAYKYICARALTHTHTYVYKNFGHLDFTLASSASLVYMFFVNPYPAGTESNESCHHCRARPACMYIRAV